MSFFVKIKARVLDLWLDECFGPEWSKTSYNVLDPKVKIFFKIWKF